MFLIAAILSFRLVAAPSCGDTYTFDLFPSEVAPAASGIVRMQPIASPFGIGASPDGHLAYTLRATLKDLPELAGGKVYVAWLTTPLLDRITRLGTVKNGDNDIGRTDLNKFRVIITVEDSPTSDSPHGVPALRGISPSSRMQPHDYSNIGIGPPC